MLFWFEKWRVNEDIVIVTAKGKDKINEGIVDVVAKVKGTVNAGMSL